MSRSIAVVMALAVISVGCGRSYHLPGHRHENLDSPPDVKLRVGERRKAISTGMTVKDMGPAGGAMVSDTPDVVSVESPNRGTAYLVAKSLGQARVRYYYFPSIRRDPDNHGFLVTVVPGK